MTSGMHTTKIKRYYALMWIAITLALFIVVAAGKPPNGSFQAAMWCWIAISAFRGDIKTAKWIVGALTVLAIIGMALRLTVADLTFEMIWPSLDKRDAILSSAITVVIYGAVFLYAQYIDVTPEGTTRASAKAPHVGQGHSSKSDGHTNSESYREGTAYKPNSSNNSAANSAWSTAAAYFPDIKELYQQLGEIDAQLAERFKSERISMKDFSNAQREYWRLLNELAQEVCGSGTSNARNFLLTTINNRDFETARSFITLGRVLGAGNMSDHVLAKFKSSRGDISKLIELDQDDEWNNAATQYPQIKHYHEKLRKISSKQAEAYKSKLLSTQNFFLATEFFESSVDEIVDDHCRGRNWQPREYLQKAILRGKSDIARQFIAFAQKTGPENMDNAALDRFKRSIDPLWDRDDG